MSVATADACDDAALRELLSSLPQEALQEIGKTLRSVGKPLTRRQKFFVSEYAVDLNKQRAAAAARDACRMAKEHEIVPGDINSLLELKRKLEQHEEGCRLKAEYVREYIFSILELCPTDYFTIADDGQWMIEPEQFRNLPSEVKRLVESTEIRFVKNTAYFSVKFMSKTAALALAAKFTLIQKVDATVRSLPWDQIARELEHEAQDDIEGRLKVLEAPMERTNGKVA